MASLCPKCDFPVGAPEHEADACLNPELYEVRQVGGKIWAAAVDPSAPWDWEVVGTTVAIWSGDHEFGWKAYIRRRKA